ncbi:MAG: hypothetical protein LBG19_12130 [Prevotellaceae bacterium]|jgi:hypothetical protein|nr:hypothetical protein [Prevotellaceae bacterium]
MKRVICIVCLILLSSVALYSQSVQDVTVKRERTFTGEGLYGFMNGGADLYLEYGVQELVTRDVVFRGEEYTVDIYTMPSAADAFGIYSVNVFKCDKADELGYFDCLSTYQLLFAVGNKYISVVFQSGSDEARSSAEKLIKKYVAIDKEEKLSIPAELQLSLPYSGRLKYLKGPLSISNTDFSLATMLTDIAYTDVWYIQNRQTKENKALVFVKTKDDLTRLKADIAEENILSIGDNLVFFECVKKEMQKEDLGNFAF